MTFIFLSALEHRGEQRNGQLPALSSFVTFGSVPTDGGNAINYTFTLMWQIPKICWLV